MVTPEDIREAASLIRSRIIRTPLVHSPTFSRRFGADIYLKLENLQKTGSFKIRGAVAKVLKRRREIAGGGVVAASAGNHAQGVALAARTAGIPAAIVMPEWASITKQEATRGYGGEVILHGRSLEESLQRARELAAEGRTFIHPFDDPDIIAGQGSVALEIQEDLDPVGMIVVPIGGGGLISGIAVAAKSLWPDVTVVGVQASVCPSAQESLAHGRPVRVRAETSIADGISVKQVGERPLAVLQRLVDRVVLVSEEEIAAAILMLLERKKILAEGAGAVALAALLSGVAAPAPGTRVVLLVSGGNVDSPLLGRIINKGLVKKGRLTRLWVPLSDTPGALARLLARIADHKANVLHISHDRGVEGMPLFSTCVELELATRGPEHIREITRDLQLSGYGIEVR